MILPAIVKRLKRAFTNAESLDTQLAALDQQIEDLKINQGIALALSHRGLEDTNLQAYEFKVFSQWGEDGIIQRLIDTVNIEHKTFIEFGVEDFSEANCLFLLRKDNWRGFVIDGSPKNMQRLREAPYFWKYDLHAVDAFITRANINELLARSGFDGDLGILSVDIDGNDYHVLQAISGWRPRILICEYNAAFGSQRNITVPYDPSFQRTSKHHSNLYFGASLGAMAALAGRLGYVLVGTNSNGANAFFVRQDLMNDKLRALTTEQAFTPSLFRESRDAQGRLTYFTGEDRLKVIKGLPVVNVETGLEEPL